MTRALDVALSALALIVLSPLLLLVALAVRIDSPGPALYRQVRVGRRGAPFRIVKFRTMVDGAERQGTTVTAGGDRRVTRLGRMLRRSKLDELPQLLNVLRGDMSLVGPRPDVPEIIAGYTADMRRILEVRPGLTSVASLDLADEESLLALAPDPDAFYARVVVPAKVRLSMRHVDDRSLGLYLAVVAATALKLTRRLLGAPPEGELTRGLRAALSAEAAPGAQAAVPRGERPVGSSG